MTKRHLGIVPCRRILSEGKTSDVVDLLLALCMMEEDMEQVTIGENGMQRGKFLL